MPSLLVDHLRRPYNIKNLVIGVLVRALCGMQGQVHPKRRNSGGEGSPWRGWVAPLRRNA